MAFRRIVSPVLDAAEYTNVPATGSKVSFVIESGEYTPPIWLQVEGGPVIRIDTLPFRTVLKVPE